MKKHTLIALLAPLFLALFAACENSPVSKLVNPTIGNTTGSWQGGEWVVYDDEIKTGGTVMMYTTMQGQELDFNWTGSPYRGSKCIKYSWDGSDVTAYASPGQLEHGYVGFSLIVADSVEKYSTVSKNLVPGGYSKISFRVRGSLASGVSLVLKGNSESDIWTSNDTDRKVTDAWQRFEFPVNTAGLAITRDFVRILLTFNNPDAGRGNGGTVYIDDIRLER